MDSFFRSVTRRLTLYCVLLVWSVSALAVSGLQFTSGPFATQGAAYSACASDAAHNNVYSNGNGTWTCKLDGNSPPNGYYDIFFNTSVQGTYFFPYGSGGTPNPCAALPSLPNQFIAGKAAPAKTFSQAVVDPATGATVHCAYTMKPVGTAGPVMNQYGTWGTWVSMVPSGNPAGGGAADGVVTNLDGSPSNPPIPNVPANNSAGPTTPPQVCGGGSCQNAATDQFCATSGGAQFCVTGSTARSPAGGCASSGDSTLCAGSPSAPLPPAASVPNPATSAKGSDQYTQADPTTGANQTVTVNTYTNPGGATATSGQKTGDVGPASSSSTGNSDSFSGGGDCNSPPVCSGDAATCGIARETWTAMCTAKSSADSLQKVFVGDGTQTPTLAPLHAASDLDGQTVDLGDTSGADSSGMGWSTTCPLQDFTITVVGVSVPLSFKPVCDYGAWMRTFVMLLASIGYAGIMGGFKVGSIFGGGGSD